MSGRRELDIVESERFDYAFADEIVKRPGGEHLYTCASCGTCTKTCRGRRVDASFNPRLMILKATLGFRDEVLSGSEIWECSACDACYPRCPNKIHISELFRAMRDVAISHGYGRHGVPAQVNVATCMACGMCGDACPYHAIQIKPVTWNLQARYAAQVDKNLCLECGICNAVCPSSAISVQGYADRDLYPDLVINRKTVGSVRGNQARREVLALVCNWYLHANVDVRQALQPSEGVEVVRVPCAGRVSPLFLLTALRRGANGVLVVGCNEGECHYKHGSDMEARRLDFFGDLFEMLGMEKRRLRFARIGSLDRGRFARLASEFAEEVQGIRPLPRALERSA